VITDFFTVLRNTRTYSSVTTTSIGKISCLVSRIFSQKENNVPKSQCILEDSGLGEGEGGYTDN
jgi:hypothetical protein